MNSAGIEHLARRFAHRFQGQDPDDPATRRSIEQTLAGVRGVIEGLQAQPPSEYGSWRVADFTQEDEQRVVESILTSLRSSA